LPPSLVNRIAVGRITARSVASVRKLVENLLDVGEMRIIK